MKNKSSGISFLEIMISLLLVSIIVLGVLANQTGQTKQAATLKQYMLSSLGLRNLAEKMIANSKGTRLGFYQNSFKSNPKDCIKFTCDAKEISAYDISQSTLEMQEYLPEFKFKISTTGTYQYKLSASWQGIDKDQSSEIIITTPR
jgi:Tfp pilus assembly protein PilV